MTTRRTMIIVTEAYAPKLTILSSLMDWTQDYTQGPALCAYDPAATPASPVTHRFTNAEGMPQVITDRFVTLAAGTYLPQVDFAEVEGLTLAEALQAKDNIIVITKAGVLSANVDGDLQAEGLMFLPSGVEI